MLKNLPGMETTGSLVQWENEVVVAGEDQRQAETGFQSLECLVELIIYPESSKD